MSFQLPDIIIESVIRDGLEDLRRNPQHIDDIFGSLTRSYASKKYGIAELNKIKELIQKKDIAVVHSFHEVSARLPCFSIQLTSDVEDRATAHLDDFEGDELVDLADPDELAALVKVSGITIDSYDPLSGEIKVPDAVDLSQTHVNLLFVDSAGVEHTIVGGIDNTAGQKKFFVAEGSDVTTTGTGEIKSSIDYKQYEVRGVLSNANMLIGVHSQEALLTKYLYMLLKYFLLSRKADLEARCYIVSSYQGSDFTRNLDYQGDVVYDRFLTVTGKVEDSWRSDQVQLVDHVIVTTKVDKDEASTDDLDLDESTIQIIDDEDL